MMYRVCLEEGCRKERLLPLLLRTLCAIFIFTLLQQQAIAANVTQSDSWNAISHLQDEVEALALGGHATERFHDLLTSVELLHGQGHYEEASAGAEEATELIAVMLDAERFLNTTSFLLEEAARLDLEAREALLANDLARSEYAKHNYEGAYRYAKQSHAALVTLLTPESGRVVEGARRLSERVNAANITLSSVNETLQGLEEAQESGELLLLFRTARNLAAMNRSITDLILVRKEMEEMERQGYATIRIGDHLKEMERSFDEGRYEEVLLGYNATLLLTRDIDRTLLLIEQTEERLARPEVAGIDFSEARSLLNLSRRELGVENYEQARAYAEEAAIAAEETERSHLFTTVLNRAKVRFDFLSYLKEHWWQLLLFLLIAAIAGSVAHHLLRLRLNRHRIARLQREQQVLGELTKRLQWEYYKERTIDKESFLETDAEYTRRQDEIAEQLPLLKKRGERLRTRGERLRNALLGLFRRKGSRQQGVAKKRPSSVEVREE